MLHNLSEYNTFDLEVTVLIHLLVDLNYVLSLIYEIRGSVKSSLKCIGFNIYLKENLYWVLFEMEMTMNFEFGLRLIKVNFFFFISGFI